MKKIISLLLLTILTLSVFTSCFSKNGTSTDQPGNNEQERKTVRIGYLTGPTGMGMAKMIIDNNGLNGGNEKYTFTKYADTQAAKTDLASGKIDVICLPTNEAALFQSKIDTDAKILAVNCLNSLFLISNETEMANASLEDYEGKTIYTCKNGTPRIVLEYILKELEINAVVSYTVDGKDMVTPADVSAQILAGNIPNAVLPEPLISTAIIKTSSSDTKYIRSVDLSDEWSKIFNTPITMGCLVADGDFVKENKYSIDLFLEEYKASVEYISNKENADSAADYIQKTTIIPALPIAKSALANLDGSIVYMDGANMKNAIIAFYAATNVALPDESIYYEK